MLWCAAAVLFLPAKYGGAVALHILVRIPDVSFNIDLGLLNSGTKKSSLLCRESILELRPPEPITSIRPWPDFQEKVM